MIAHQLAIAGVNQKPEESGCHGFSMLGAIWNITGVPHVCLGTLSS
jgi:hypothetical protein